MLCAGGAISVGLEIKPGVRVQGLRPETALAVQVIEGAFRDAGFSVATLTAAIDGTHMPGSLHYVGCAVDFRIRDIPEAQREPLRATIARRLTADYDVVLEGDHFHIEYQPKQPYTGA